MDVIEEMEATIGRLLLEINRLGGEVAVLTTVNETLKKQAVSQYKELTDENQRIESALQRLSDLTQYAEAIENKKEWQYLTEAEILEIVSGGRIFIHGFGYEGGIGSYTRKLFDKIEAKIKEKNDISSS